MKIDVHAHYVPEKCLDAEAKGTDGHIHGMRVVQEGSRQVAYTNNARNLALDPPQIYSIERRLKDMATQWVDMQVLSVPPFLFFYAADPAQSLELCQKINNAFAETVQKYPDRFVALANLPMQDPEMAARELERSVRELGLRGAEICSNINGKNLDDKSFVPFYTKLQELDVPVFIHPSNVLGADRLRPYHLQNLIGKHSGGRREPDLRRSAQRVSAPEILSRPRRWLVPLSARSLGARLASAARGSGKY